MDAGSSRPDDELTPIDDLEALAKSITGSRRVPGRPPILRRNIEGEPNPVPVAAGVVNCFVWDNYPHVLQGGKVLNPESMKPLPGPPRRRHKNLPEENGLTVLAIRVRDGVLVGINHLSEVLEPKGLALDGVVRLMTQKLSSRPEKDHALYRVDGMGGLIKGNIFITGCGFRRLYSSLNLRRLIVVKQSFPDAKSDLDLSLKESSHYEEYSVWSRWSIGEAAKLAARRLSRMAANEEDCGDLISMFGLERDGMARPLFCDHSISKYLPEGGVGRPGPRVFIDTESLELDE
ncbi:OLC1v1037433C1 [Oldenlandia corymbosa var. corymbosa]|uniref:OLC1v1037433C1 n=1 Tax=Oldenlandia corymbosa var. corymbosa TaxID=529605 RepID=A0AAV1CYB5_OLDCO|nr:OLC1v1037433C1 [Oldenlandia corymbosa var. corymbosa]